MTKLEDIKWEPVKVIVPEVIIVGDVEIMLTVEDKEVSNEKR